MDRQLLDNLETMKIRTAEDDEIPIQQVADTSITQAPAVINRSDRYRTIHVTADADQKIVQLTILQREMNFLATNLRRDKQGEVSFQCSALECIQERSAFRDAERRPMNSHAEHGN